MDSAAKPPPAIGHDDGHNAASSSSSSLVTVDVSSAVGREYVPLFEDVVRMICIQLSVQLMVYFTSSSDAVFLTSEFLLTLIYIVVGVMLYWLVFRKLVRFA